MMSSYASEMINHVKEIARWTAERGATSSMLMPTGVLRIQWKNKIFEFQPQFKNRAPEGSWQLTPGLSPHSEGFCGWLPYFNKQWPAACKKLEFKRFASDNGIRTPAYWVASGLLENVVRKQEISSFGNGIVGPYARVDATSAGHQLHDGEYFESYIAGKVAKILYWNGQPVCLEILEMASVTGDGRQTIKSLLGKVSSFQANRERALSIATCMLEYQGKSMDSVPEKGETILVDHRYGSPFYKTTATNTNCLAGISPELRQQLGAIGAKLLETIQEPIRKQTAFSVDGILDDSDQLWCVEMNCNPQLHPDIYPTMLSDLFDNADAVLDSYKPIHLNGNRHPAAAGVFADRR